MAALISHAQNFEDVMLWRALRHVGSGRYIDIGAQDPVVDSVSQLFHEHGWRGTHVEPTPDYVAKLRAARRGDLVIEAAIAAKSGTMAFFEIPGTGLGTGSAALAKSHAKRGLPVHEIVVAALTLDQLLEREPEGDVHWLKIDVEGAEKQVLEGWRTARARPWILVIESTKPMTQVQTHRQWEPLVLAKGYKFAYFDGLNRFYVSAAHPELLAAFAAPPNVFDGFALSGTASSTLSEHLNGRIRELELQAQRQLRGHEEALAAREREWKVREEEHEKKRQWLENERASLGQRLEASQHAALVASSALAAREQELGTQLAAGLAGASRLAQELAERERELVDRLQAAQGEALAAAQRHAQAVAEAQATSLRHAAELAEAGSEARLSAQRQGEMEAQLLVAKTQVAAHGQALRDLAIREQEVRDALGAVRTEIRSTARALADREREFSTQLLGAQAEVSRVNALLAGREAALGEALRAARHEADAAAARLAGQEREGAHKVTAALDAVRKAERERAELEEALAAQVATLRLEARELVHSQQLREAALAEERREWQAELARRDELRALLALRLDEMMKGEAEASRQHREALAAMLADMAAALANPMARPVPASGGTWPRLASAGALDALPIAAPRHVRDLLALQDRAFVDAAYLALLKRRPDGEGLAYYLGRLRSGYPKVQVLSQLLDSGEGHERGASLPGLEEAVRWFRLGALPIIGPAVRRRRSLPGTSAAECALRSLEQRVAGLREHSEGRLARIEEATFTLRELNTAQGEPRQTAQVQVALRLRQLPVRARRVHAQLTAALAKPARTVA